jgi:small subunit ribosomal protein S17
MEKKQKTKENKKEEKSAVQTPVSGSSTRGRFFEGTVTKIFPTRVVMEFGRVVKVHKYERFYKKKTRIHAKLPQGMNVQVGDYIRVAECRPLSKIIHFIVVSKIRSAQTAEVKQ